MARIAGVDLPRDKRVEIGLTSIYGIGRTSATKIVDKAGVNPDTRCRDLTDEEVKKLSEETQKERCCKIIKFFVTSKYGYEKISNRNFSAC